MQANVIELIFLLLAHAAAGIYSSTLKYSKKTTYIIWGVWVAVQSMIMFFAESVLPMSPLLFLISFILPLIGQYVIFFATTKGRLAQRLFTMLTYSIFFCIGITFFLMVRAGLGERYSILTMPIQATLLFALVTYFLRNVCALCRTAAKNITTGWTPLIIVNIIFLITLVFTLFFPTRLSTFRDPSFVPFALLSVSIMAVYPVIFSNINSLSEAAHKRETEQQNKLLLAQIEAESAQLAADRQARHDRRHHNMVMLELANNNDLESVREYLRRLVDSDSRVWGEVRYCENRTVNTVLTVYGRRAKESGIAVTISADVSRDVDILPQDLVIVIANLFENAVHAAAALKSPDKTIDISIKESAQRLLIKVENTCKERMTFDDSLYGIGIHSVIAVAGKYDGMYDFSAADGIFSAKISLNLK